MCSHISRAMLGVEPQPGEELDAARSGLEDAVGDSRRPRAQLSGRPSLCGEFIESRERRAQTLGESGKTRHHREQRGERLVLPHRHGNLGDGVGPRRERASGVSAARRWSGARRRARTPAPAAVSRARPRARPARGSLSGRRRPPPASSSRPRAARSGRPARCSGRAAPTTRRGCSGASASSIARTRPSSASRRSRTASDAPKPSCPATRSSSASWTLSRAPRVICAPSSGASDASSSATRSTSRWPARLPESTVDT